LYDLKKYTIWCVRNSNDRSTPENNYNRHSGPCSICVSRLLKLGFTKMGFSDNDGNMVVVKLAEYENHYTTSSQKKLKNNITI
tara:strand:+ start:617 stop:865 length:249 start_codon:yes stop_codon:yes gene_type:complete